MYDEKLVRAAQQGDEAAFAAIYDRSADAVYDLCWSLIGDADEAARIVEDTFVLAARHLNDLSDASQVRAWLLAIARDRILTEDERGTLRFGWGSAPVEQPDAGPEEPLGTVALRTWTAAAAAVLALTDQAVLELHLRHQLDEEQLAAAVGCSPEQLPSVVARVDAEAEHVLGALVVARQARRDCPELLDALRDWDGTPTVEVADLVDAHAEACERCRRRRSLVSPLELIAAAPLVTAPSALRNQVVDLAEVELADHRLRGSATGAETAAVAAVGAEEADAATAPLVESRRRPLAPLFVVAAAVLVLAGALTLVLRSPSRQQPVAAVRPGSLNVAPGPTTSGTSTPTTAVLSLLPVDTTTITSTTVAPYARLELNASRVDFGSDATTAQVTLRNTGAGATDWVGSSAASWLSLAPASGHLDGSGAVSVTLTVDRRVAPRGPFDIRIAFQPADSNQPAASLYAVGSATGSTTTAPSTTSTTVSSSSTTVASGPSFSNISASPSTVYAAPCNPDTSKVSATVSDPGTVTAVTIVYTLSDGRRGTSPMTQTGNGAWTGTLGPSSSAGTTSFVVTATDANGARSTSDSYTVNVTACH